MNDHSPSPPLAPKSRLTIGLLAAAVVGFLVIAFSFGGLVFWLVVRRPAPATAHADGGSKNAPTDALADAPVEELFNGRDLEGWLYDPVVWDVRNGVIHGSKTKAGGLIWQGGDVEDFELRFRFRLIRGNSGVYYRARPLPNYGVGGYEFEIWSDRLGNLSDNGKDRPRRNLFRRVTPEGVDTNWHDVVITATGARLVHQIDGEVICDVEDNDPAALRRGTIVFENGGNTTVDFKDLQLKRISPAR